MNFDPNDDDDDDDDNGLSGLPNRGRYAAR